MVEANPEPDKIIGIDLGTTNTAVAFMQNKLDGTVEKKVIQNRDGFNTTPSIFQLKPDPKPDPTKRKHNSLVGFAASNSMQRYPEQTYYDAKRILGRDFDHDDVQKDIEADIWPFKV